MVRENEKPSTVWCNFMTYSTRFCCLNYHFKFSVLTNHPVLRQSFFDFAFDAIGDSILNSRLQIWSIINNFSSKTLKIPIYMHVLSNKLAWCHCFLLVVLKNLKTIFGLTSLPSKCRTLPLQVLISKDDMNPVL